MLRSVNQPVTGSNDGDNDGTIAALRHELSELADQVSQISSMRLEQAKRLAEAGTAATRGQVEAYPLTSLALAFAGGAAIGLVVMGARPAPKSSRSWRSMDLSDVRGDLADYTEQMKRQIRRAAAKTNLADRFEHMADSVSAADAKSTVMPIVNRVASWLEKARTTAVSAAEEVVKKV